MASSSSPLMPLQYSHHHISAVENCICTCACVCVGMCVCGDKKNINVTRGQEGCRKNDGDGDKALSEGAQRTEW